MDIDFKMESSYLCGVEGEEVLDNLEGLEKGLRFESCLVSVGDIILADNIRPFDSDFIDTLSLSILEHGQIQECIGYELLRDDERFVVVIAGQHRFKAIERLNDKGYCIPVRVSIASRELSPIEIVKLQITENLHNKMTSAQEAEVIANLWSKIKAIKESNAERPNMSEFARNVSRSVSTVRDAVKYVDGVSPVVQKIVDEGVLPYTQALLLADIDDLSPSEEGKNPSKESIEHKQLYFAELFVAKKFTLRKAKSYLESLRNEKGFSGSLFGEDWKEMEVRNKIIAIRDESDKQGRDAAGWFVKMISLADVLDKSGKDINFSDAIRSAIVNLGYSLEDFKDRLREYLPDDDYNRLFEIEI